MKAPIDNAADRLLDRLDTLVRDDPDAQVLTVEEMVGVMVTLLCSAVCRYKVTYVELTKMTLRGLAGALEFTRNNS